MRRLSVYSSFLARVAWWCRAHHSLRIVAQLGSFSQPECTLLIISARLLWNANIYAQTEPSPSAWLRSSGLPKGCRNRRWEVFALNRRREPESKSPPYRPLLFAFSTLSQVQNNQIPCSPRPGQTKADGRRNRADKNWTKLQGGW